MKEGDKTHNLEDLKKEVANFCEERNWDKEHKPKELAIGVVTEASELLEIFRFLSEEDSLLTTQKKETRTKISEELADTHCFILRFAQLYKFDLTESLKNKLKKNALKYPAPKKKE